MNTAELADILLGPGAAALMAHHELADPIFPGGPLGGIQFFARPQSFGKDLCRRDSFYVSLSSRRGDDGRTAGEDLPVTKERVSEGFQIALAPGCRLKPNGYFARVQDAASVEGASALERLVAIQQMARSARPQDLSLRCTSDLAENPCGNNPRAVLARLPLHQIFIIKALTHDGAPAWEFSVMPQGPGHHPFWEVMLQERPGQQPQLRMNWRIPAPF